MWRVLLQEEAEEEEVLTRLTETTKKGLVENSQINSAVWNPELVGKSSLNIC